jgi:hypothetical protein
MVERSSSGWKSHGSGRAWPFQASFRKIVINVILVEYSIRFGARPVVPHEFVHIVSKEIRFANPRANARLNHAARDITSRDTQSRQVGCDCGLPFPECRRSEDAGVSVSPPDTSCCRSGRRFVVPDPSRPHRFRQVIADGHHDLPDRLHGLDEQLVDPVSISFGIEYRTRQLDRDVSVALP